MRRNFHILLPCFPLWQAKNLGRGNYQMGIITNFASKNASIMHQCMSIGKIQELTICGSLQTHSIPPPILFLAGREPDQGSIYQSRWGVPSGQGGEWGTPPPA